MAFLNQFATYFTSQERETELYNLWSSIGVNMEKAIYEEQTKINTEFTDINNFSEDTMRSWLSFFLQKIPYRTTATTQVSVSLQQPPSDQPQYARTQINKYDELTTDDGIIYTTMEDITLLGNDVRTVTAVQGTRITETGVYNSIIKVQANNPDLSYLVVKLDGVEIPEVSYETSYDDLSFLGSWKPQSTEDNTWGGTPFLQDAYGKKGQAYFVIADGETRFSDEGIPIEFRKGDVVVFDGNNWQRSLANNNLSPVQFANTYAVPRNGFFAYYFDGYLYIKIFSGNEVVNPNGCNYEVSYIKSDGIQGEIKENTLTFVSSYEDLNENTVKLNVSNTKSTVAVNEPSTGKLGLYLKQRLYSSINVSSVPEYMAWFNAQPEVGDCLVLSDYERYVRKGKTDYQDITGIVDVYLVDPNGDELTNDVKDRLLTRIEPYKDIAVLRIQSFTPIYHYLRFEYTTTTSPDAFEQFVKSKASMYYNLSYLQSKNSSLFEDLDLALVIKDIQETSPYDSTGLIVKGYHYLERKIEPSNKEVSITSYSNEKPGTGWYTLTYTEKQINPQTGEEEDVEVIHRLEEAENIGSDISSQIYDVADASIPVGNHTDNLVSLHLSRYDFTKTATLRCYWGMKNDGILAIGAEDGLRRLYKIDVVKVS